MSALLVLPAVAGAAYLVLCVAVVVAIAVDRRLPSSVRKITR